MDLHPRAVAGFGMSGQPPIPQRGLDEMLRAWSGQGQLWDALAAISDPVAERQWTAQDIRRRAHRVLFQQLEPLLMTWPAQRRTWLYALPAESLQTREVGKVPTSGTSWSETRRGGWPPSSFVSRPRVRRADSLLTTTLKWVLDQLVEVRRAAATPSSEVQWLARSRLDVAAALLAVDPLASTTAMLPRPTDLVAMRAAGRPWRSVAPVAALLRTLSGAGLLELAARVVAPDGDLAWRLFHLAVLGELLHALRAAGATVVSVRPLGDSASGPAFKVLDARAREWDLWFEAAGAWRRYGRKSPYAAAAAGVPGAGSALGADLLLIRPAERALVIECKYSWNPSVVARGGYEQAVTYAAEAHEMAPGHVRAVVTGPRGVVEAPGFTYTIAGRVDIVPPETLRAIAAEVLDA
jgi:hypothetical protein